jgi:hypothetical protein
VGYEDWKQFQARVKGAVEVADPEPSSEGKQHNSATPVAVWKTLDWGSFDWKGFTTEQWLSVDWSMACFWGPWRAAFGSHLKKWTVQNWEQLGADATHCLRFSPEGLASFQASFEKKTRIFMERRTIDGALGDDILAAYGHTRTAILALTAVTDDSINSSSSSRPT